MYHSYTAKYIIFFILEWKVVQSVWSFDVAYHGDTFDYIDTVLRYCRGFDIGNNRDFSC